jgi:hypothetical protein
MGAQDCLLPADVVMAKGCCPPETCRYPSRRLSEHNKDANNLSGSPHFVALLFSVIRFLSQFSADFLAPETNFILTRFSRCLCRAIALWPHRPFVLHDSLSPQPWSKDYQQPSVVKYRL